MAPATCDGGQCVSFTQFDFTLVASLPESSYIDPGVTIAIPQFASVFLASLLPNQEPVDCQSPDCIQLPEAIGVLGTLEYDDTVTTCQLAAKTEVPASVTFRPSWSTPGTATVDATSIGLPLPTISSGPAPGSDPSSWVAVVGPVFLPVLGYEEAVVPVDDSYPPVRFDGFPQSPTDVMIDQCPGSTSTTTFRVKSDGPSLRGFQVYLRDAATLERVSSRVTFGDVLTAQVTLYTVNQKLQGKQVVIQPPAGLPIPTFADAVSPLPQLADETFPSLPSAVTVSGTVRDATFPSGNPIEADLIIDSTPGGIVDTDISALNTQQGLSYSASAHSSPLDGSYSVVLPPGTYEVFVVPASGVAAGATYVPLDVAAPQNGAPAAGAGKTLIAAALGTIAGNVTVADRRVLSGATVEAHAAASLAGTDPRLWPRTASTLADASGEFALTVDPGTYDVVARPVDGSGFPWVTMTSVIVSSGGVAQPLRFVVPAPIPFPLTLHDIADNPIASAVVRAFAPSVTKLAPDGGIAPQIELGAWVTDQNGSFTMLLAPPE